MALDSPAEPAPITIAGRYRLARRLGTGGMGEVWLADDLQLRRQVAFKMLLPDPEQDSKVGQRLLREAWAAAAINHPHVAHVYDAGEFEGRRYIAMEWVRGRTLEDRLREGPLDLESALRIAVEIAEALAAAHDQNVVHRDVKPSNVVLSDRGVKVLDFGLAKVALATAATGETRDSGSGSGAVEAHDLTMMQTVLQTREGTLTGTVPYMSPEQARMEEVDHRTDLFSLAVVLYEMLAGERPFRGKSVFETLLKITTGEPSPLSDRRSDLPDDVQRIVALGMAKERDARYATAAAMAEDLRRAIAGLGSDDSASPRRSRAVGWRRWVLIAGCVVALAAAGWQLRPRGGTTALVPGAGMAADRGEIRSLAVLPFEAVEASGSQEDQDYLADGLTEELINRLSRLDELRIVSRASAFRFKGNRDLELATIGERLSADALVTGRVRQAGEEVVVSVELTVGDEQVWGQRFQRAAGDLYALQTDVASTIAGQLVDHLSDNARRQLSGRGTDDAQAYRLYLRGLFYWNRATSEGVDQAIRYFSRAIDRDAGFALAHAGLAMAYAIPFGETTVPSSRALEQARASARRALEIDPDLPQAHVALASAELWFGLDLDAAEAGFRHALALDPSNALGHHQYGWMLAFAGRPEEARRQLDLALELDPMSLVILTDSCLPDVVAADVAPALACLRNAQAAAPDFFLPFFVEGWLHLQLGDLDAAVGALEQALARERAVMVLAFLGNGVARRGDTARAERLLAEIAGQNAGAQFLVAVVQVGLGDHDAAFASLKAGLEAHDGWMLWLPLDRVLEPLQSDPRWASLVDTLRAR